MSTGDEAPNFDLSSTEGVLLMLRDEVIRTRSSSTSSPTPATSGCCATSTRSTAASTTWRR